MPRKHGPYKMCMKGKINKVFSYVAQPKSATQNNSLPVVIVVTDNFTLGDEATASNAGHLFVRYHPFQSINT